MEVSRGVEVASAAQESRQEMSSQVRSKLLNDLSVVENNTVVLGELVSTLTPGQEHPEDLVFIKELYDTCKEMQERVVGLVSRSEDDVLTADSLRVNDLLNNVFIRYDRYMSKSEAKGDRSNTATPSGFSAAHNAIRPVALEPLDISLIDLNDETPPAFKPLLGSVAASSQKEKGDDDFDSFAQLRTGSASASTDIPVDGAQSTKDDGEFNSMERWMNAQDRLTNEPYGAEVSSDAFQKFLDERATAVEKMPPKGN